jgi:hypothetical protein
MYRNFFTSTITLFSNSIFFNLSFSDEIEKLKLKNIELENNVIVDVKKLRYIKSIIRLKS